MTVTVPLNSKRESFMRRLSGHAVAERIVFAVVLNVCLVSIGCALGQAFPAPGRPVAPIVSPAYTSEDTRDQAGEAERVMNRLGIRPGLRVADIGAGHGYYTVRLIRGEPGDPTLPAASVDIAILAHVYHELANPYEFLYRLRPALAAGGRLAIVDVDKPTQEHGTPPALVRCELAAVGYQQTDFVFLAPADGYLAVFVPPDRLPPVTAIKPCAG